MNALAEDILIYSDLQPERELPDKRGDTYKVFRNGSITYYGLKETLKNCVSVLEIKNRSRLSPTSSTLKRYYNECK
jgi:hypothetical protein